MADADNSMSAVEVQVLLVLVVPEVTTLCANRSNVVEIVNVEKVHMFNFRCWIID